MATRVAQPASHSQKGVSIAPLLKPLVAQQPISNKDVKAALALAEEGDLSEAQASLLLGLLKITKYPLDKRQLDRLDDFLNVTNALSRDQPPITAAPILRELMRTGDASAEDIAEALSLVLDNQLSTIQSALLLGLLAFAGLDRKPVVLVKTAAKMLVAAHRPDQRALRRAIVEADRSFGKYQGGLCDIVGTGGDGHSTYNVSTTASIVASSLLLLSKHGNRASSSTSGSADLLEAIQPKGVRLAAVTAETLPRIYRHSSYAFLFAPLFHPGMKHVAALRKDLGISTIFNLLGPLVNPVEDCIEARIVGVAKKDMGPVFAEALRLKGAKKAMVVCGAENLDEISCAGKTFCWRLVDEADQVRIEEFEVEPSDFDLAPHSLSEVAGGKSPQENAKILIDLLDNKLQPDDPVLDFVLINTAALFAVSGICEESRNGSVHELASGFIEERGPGGQRWKEGVRLAREVLQDGRALDSFQRYVNTTHEIDT